MRYFLLDADMDYVQNVARNFHDTMLNIVTPILIVLGGLATIYAIYLGVMYAKAEDPNKRKEVQRRLIGAVVGVIIIIVGVILCTVIDWENIIKNNGDLINPPSSGTGSSSSGGGGGSSNVTEEAFGFVPQTTTGFVVSSAIKMLFAII
ncbi:MAG: Mbov_0395 family pilin-like conjugal transfer protein [Christensenellales bacterium]